MKPLPWSYSLLDKYDNCPHSFAEVKVYKRWKDKPHDANEWGNRAHKGVELACKQEKPLEPEMAYLQPLVTMVDGWRMGCTEENGGLVMVEKKLAINLKLEPCDFFSNDVFGRGVADILYVFPKAKKARILDWKTGKRKQSEQMIYLALLTFYNYPTVDLIRTDFVWIKDGKNDPRIFAREDIPAMWQMVTPLMAEYKQAFKDENWPKRTSGLCKGWCAVENCEHWSKKK